MPPLALFALLGDEAIEVFYAADQRWWGLYAKEPPQQRDMFLAYYRDDIVAHFECGRTTRSWLSDYGNQNASGG